MSAPGPDNRLLRQLAWIVGTMVAIGWLTLVWLLWVAPALQQVGCC